MVAKDQKKAIRALFALGPKAQDRYAEKKFAPHSERQMAELRTILKQHSYPGERLIGHDTYMSTILSHHNSISQDYNQRDSIYPTLKPQLWAAVLQGYLYPYDFALIDEWYRSVKQGHDKAFYGILNPPNTSELGFTNQLRKKVLIRSVELRNKLVEVEEKTGMNFYLKGAPWIKGKIKISI